MPKPKRLKTVEVDYTRSDSAVIRVKEEEVLAKKNLSIIQFESGTHSFVGEIERGWKNDDGTLGYDVRLSSIINKETGANIDPAARRDETLHRIHSMAPPAPMAPEPEITCYEKLRLVDRAAEKAILQELELFFNNKSNRHTLRQALAEIDDKFITAREVVGAER